LLESAAPDQWCSLQPAALPDSLAICCVSLADG